MINEAADNAWMNRMRKIGAVKFHGHDEDTDTLSRYIKAHNKDGQELGKFDRMNNKEVAQKQVHESIISFKSWIKQNNIIESYEVPPSSKPYDQYTSADGHKITVHLYNTKTGTVAKFHNTNLGKTTKLVHVNHTNPDKNELRAIGQSELNEAAPPLTPDAAGKVAEHATALHLIDHVHKQNGTHGSEAHADERRPHELAVNKLAEGKDRASVTTRLEHGKSAGQAIVAHVAHTHGPSAKITAVAHTSKNGDIGKFTGGKHNDDQTNPSDVSVKVEGSEHAAHKGDHHYEGYSLKSSEKSGVITAKNPAVHMNGLLDHPTRKFDAENISRKGIAAGNKKTGLTGTAAERKRHIDATRKKEGVSSGSSIELKANENGRQAKRDVSTELHDHLHHLLTNVKGGHAIVGGMLKNHLTADTSMRWHKVHSKGSSGKVMSSVTAGSENDANAHFNNKKTRYSISKNETGERVTVHKVEHDGSLTAIAHYSPKTKSNVGGSDVHGWNVIPAVSH